MSEWKDEDEVVTTFGTIKLAAQQNFDAGKASAEWDYAAGITRGAMQERERIIKLLQDECNLCGFIGVNGLPLRCAWNIQNGDCDCQNVIALIKGENK